jgi:hypothetical protein
MKRYYIVTKPMPQLLCERAVETKGGYLLYEYVPERDAFVDSGYAESLESLKLAVRARYGFNKTVHLTTSFEEAVKYFSVSPPRVIQLSRVDEFCARASDILYYEKWDYDAEGNLFIKRKEWRLDGEEPQSFEEALQRLSKYAVKTGKWIVLRHLLKQAVAYEVYPDK